MKKKPESGAYLVMKNKPTAVSFLFTSDDRPTGSEGKKDRPLNLNITKSAPTTAVVFYLWPVGDSAGAGREFEAVELTKILRPPYVMYQ
jgi:hypothetical protein